MRTFSAFSMSVLLAVFSGAFAPACSSHDSPCVAGQQISCPCAEGGMGVQICNADGTGYEDCHACGAAATDASVDAPPDGESDAAPDANPDVPPDVDLDATADATPDAMVEAGPDAEPDSAPDAEPDAPPDAPLDVPPDGPVACVSPLDGLGGGAWPQPTPGSCQGNTAYTCNPTTHEMDGAPCLAGEICVTYEVTEHPDPSSTRQPGRSYQFASCIPDGAESCEYTFTSHPGNFPWGVWSGPAGGCVGNSTSLCRMAPIVQDAASLFVLYAGTTRGYVALVDCGAEQCATDPTSPLAPPSCYASPLVSCSPHANSDCQGNVLQDCMGYPYQKAVDCAAMGQLCRLDCDIGLTYQPAECRPPLSSSQVVCDPSTYVPSCDPAGRLVRCDDSFQVDAQCEYHVSPHSCTDIGCYEGSGFTYNCVCANVSTNAGLVAQCISPSATFCDPATTPDTCVGNMARSCSGQVVDRDCSQYGEVCALADGHAGCVAPSLTTCDSSNAMAVCAGNKVGGCCPSSGVFEGNGYGVPCAPGYEVSFDCATIFAPLVCQTVGLQAQCGM